MFSPEHKIKKYCSVSQHVPSSLSYIKHFASVLKEMAQQFSDTAGYHCCFKQIVLEQEQLVKFTELILSSFL